jgi:hypothetical protein
LKTNGVFLMKQLEHDAVVMPLVKPLSSAQVLTIAGEAEADPRTVRRVMRGKPTRGLTSERILRVLRRRGLLIEGREDRKGAGR